MRRNPNAGKFVGTKRGKLYAKADTGQRDKHGRVIYECVCDCGNVIFVSSYAIKKQKSCGCARFEDLTGHRFGKLICLRPANTPKHTKTRSKRWLCECDCGKRVETTHGILKHGHKKSCGCGRNKSSRQSAYQRVWNYYRDGAKRRGIEWELSKSEFSSLIFKPCYYCGIDFSLTSTYCRSPESIEKFGLNHNGIDRKESSKPYQVSNCVPCCTTCNMMKRTLGVSEFIEHCQKISNYFKKEQTDE